MWVNHGAQLQGLQLLAVRDGAAWRQQAQGGQQGEEVAAGLQRACLAPRAWEGSSGKDGGPGKHEHEARASTPSCQIAPFLLAPAHVGPKLFPSPLPLPLLSSPVASAHGH